MPNPFTSLYRAGLEAAGGDCPIEAGVIGRLADHECRHGRLAGDHSTPCGCWLEEPAVVVVLPTRRRHEQLPEAA